MILITTSRKPCMASRRLARRLGMLIPHSIYVTRGKKSVDGLVDYARSEGLSKIILINDFHGNPGELRVIALSKKDWDWESNYIKLQHVKVSEKKPYKPFDSYIHIKGSQGKKFKDLFSMEEAEDADIIFTGESDYLSFEQKGQELLRVKIRIMGDNHDR
jgi:rRNA maturation protein Rpf1